jgi:hypothetical protein
MMAFKIGTEVNIKHHDASIIGKINAIMLRGLNNCAAYEVVWWDGNNRKLEWLSDHEIEATDSSKKTKIGFQ